MLCYLLLMQSKNKNEICVLAQELAVGCLTNATIWVTSAMTLIFSQIWRQESKIKMLAVLVSPEASGRVCRW